MGRGVEGVEVTGGVGRQGCIEYGRATERRGEMWRGGQDCGEQDSTLRVV